MINDKILNTHRQMYENSCVASSVEMVLKLEGFIDAGSTEIQMQYGNNAISGDYFDGKTYRKGNQYIKFQKKAFPDLTSTFKCIDHELINERYVIIPLLTGIGVNYKTYHNYVILRLSEKGEYETYTKLQNREDIVDVKDMVKRFTDNFNIMISQPADRRLGIDILIYEKGIEEAGGNP